MKQDRIIVVPGLIVAVLAVAFSIVDSDPTASRFDVLGLLVLALVVFAINAGLIAWRAWRQPEHERLPFLKAKLYGWLPLLVLPVCMLLSGLGVFRDARFAISRAELQAVATGARSIDIRGDEPRRIGLYRVYEVTRKEPGYTTFDLGGCGFLDHCWLVYDSRESAERPLRAVWQPAPHWWLLQIPF